MSSLQSRGNEWNNKEEGKIGMVGTKLSEDQAISPNNGFHVQEEYKKIEIKGGQFKGIIGFSPSG